MRSAKANAYFLVAMLEEDARVAGKEVDLRMFTDRDEGMRNEYEQACLIASDALAEHQHMSDIRNGMSISDDQRPRATLMQTTAATPNNTGRQYKANGKFKPDTLTKDANMNSGKGNSGSIITHPTWT